MRYPGLLTIGFTCGLLAASSAYAVNNGDQQSYGNAQPVAGQSAENAMFDILARLEQLQSEVQQLRGMVEEQSQTIADLERKQKNMYADLDSRIQAVPAPVAPNASANPAATEPAIVSSVSAAVPAAAVPNQALPTTPAGGNVNPAAAASANPVNSGQIAPQVPLAQGSEKERYVLAYDMLRNGHNAQAIKSFETLLVDYPAGEYADNAQYWLAEAYKINREIDKSRNAFIKVVMQYPNSAKVPDALLKLGYIEADLQNFPKAREYLSRVTSLYPNSPAAHLAAKRLAQMP